MAKQSRKKKVIPKKVSYHRRPEDMELRAWQTELRRQFGQSQPFIIENMGTHPVYSEFKVFNPESDRAYKVAIRGKEAGDNFCACLDFKTNTLGTCKHIEAVLHKLLHTRGMKKHFKEPYQAGYSSVFLEYGEERRVRLRIGTEKEEALRRLADRYFEDGELKPGAFERFDQFLEKARRLSPDFRCYPDAMQYILQQRAGQRRRRHVAQLKKEDKDYLDRLLSVKLYPYQQQGVWFAAAAGRCIIADEMGLGKTVQAIAAAELWKREFNIGRVLIVCPTSLKYQWKSEIERFTGSTVEVIEGNPLKRRQRYQESEAFYLILTYHVVANDLRYVQALAPDAIILDEAQRIKNWRAKISGAVKKLHSEYALVLTGTPLENKLEELYSIVQFIDQYRLNPLFQFLHDHQVKDENGKVVGYRELKQVKEKLKDILIRRTKKKVLRQLPGRVDKNLFVPMTREQAELHEEFGNAVARLVAKWRRFGFLREQERQQLMINLNRMRMVCDSTYILDQETRSDTKVDELMFILEEALAEEGLKVVVFSQWQRMTRIVAAELEARGIPFEHLHGGVPGYQRGGLLERFRDDEDCRVFLSTDAGGVGLNLQAASLLINLDIPWNPAVLEQRIARIYRIGQRRKINVINLIATGTIEHRMLGTLAFKSEMAAGVLDDGEDSIFLDSQRFRRFMETVENVTEGSAVVEEYTSESDMEAPAAGPAAAPETEARQPDLEPILEEDEARPSRGRPPAPRREAEVPELVRMGASFFSSLAQTLADERKTRELVDSLVEKDEQSGRTYLKIPVENEQIVQQALQVMGRLFQGR